MFELRLIVEIDGGYHDYQYEGDLNRTEYLEQQGWRVLRFANEEVIDDLEATAIAIARAIGLTPAIAPRTAKPSGMMCPRRDDRSNET